MSVYQTNEAINIEDFPKIVKNNPQYTQMLAGIYQIDLTIKSFIKDIIANKTDDSVYYIKTELQGPCYNLYLYNSNIKSTVGASWLLADFLEKCDNKTIEFDINDKISLMIKKFDTKLEQNKVHWIN